MGHGIFPSYGMTYIKSWQHLLTHAEKKAVFYPEKKDLKNNKIRTSVVEEDEDNIKSRKK
jgi:hypothetical protein